MKSSKKKSSKEKPAAEKDDNGASGSGVQMLVAARRAEHSPIKPRGTRSKKRQPDASPDKSPRYCIVIYADGCVERKACEGRVVGQKTTSRYQGSGKKMTCYVVCTGDAKACDKLLQDPAVLKASHEEFFSAAVRAQAAAALQDDEAAVEQTEQPAALANTAEVEDKRSQDTGNSDGVGDTEGARPDGLEHQPAEREVGAPGDEPDNDVPANSTLSSDPVERIYEKSNNEALVMTTKEPVVQLPQFLSVPESEEITFNQEEPAMASEIEVDGVAGEGPAKLQHHHADTRNQTMSATDSPEDGLEHQPAEREGGAPGDEPDNDVSANSTLSSDPVERIYEKSNNEALVMTTKEPVVQLPQFLSVPESEEITFNQEEPAMASEIEVDGVAGEGPAKLQHQHADTRNQTMCATDSTEVLQPGQPTPDDEPLQDPLATLDVPPKETEMRRDASGQNYMMLKLTDTNPYTGVVEVELDDENSFNVPTTIPQNLNMLAVSEKPPAQLLESSEDESDEDLFIEADPPAPLSLPFPVFFGPPASEVVAREIVFDRKRSQLRRLWVIQYIPETKSIHLSIGNDAAKYLDKYSNQIQMDLIKGEIYDAGAFAFGLCHRPLPCVLGEIGQLAVCDRLRTTLLFLCNQYVTEHITGPANDDVMQEDVELAPQVIPETDTDGDSEHGDVADPDFVPPNEDELISSESSSASLEAGMPGIQEVSDSSEVEIVKAGKESMSSKMLERKRKLEREIPAACSKTPGGDTVSVRKDVPSTSRQSNEAAPQVKEIVQLSTDDDDSEPQLKKIKKEVLDSDVEVNKEKKGSKKLKEKKKNKKRQRKRKKSKRKSKKSKKSRKNKDKRRKKKRRRRPSTSSDSDSSEEESDDSDSDASSSSSSKSSSSNSSSGRSSNSHRRSKKSNKKEGKSRKGTDNKYGKTKKNEEDRKEKSGKEAKDAHVRDEDQSGSKNTGINVLATAAITRNAGETHKDYANRLRRLRREQKKSVKSTKILKAALKKNYPFEFYQHLMNKLELFTYAGEAVVYDELIGAFVGHSTPSGFCPLCEKLFRKASVHMMSVHKNEPQVKDILEQGKASGEGPNSIEFLIRRANHKLNNVRVFATNTGILIPLRRSRTPKAVQNMMMCEFCTGAIDRAGKDRHYENCLFSKSSLEHCKEVDENIALIESIQSTEGDSMKSYLCSILETIKDVKRRKFCMEDPLVFKFLLTSTYSKPRSPQLEKNVKAYGHLIARFLLPFLEKFDCERATQIMTIKRAADLHTSLMEFGKIFNFYERTDQFLADLRLSGAGRSSAQYARTLSPILKSLAKFARVEVGLKCGFQSKDCREVDELMKYMADDLLWDSPLQKALALQRTMQTMHVDPDMLLPAEDDVSRLLQDVRADLRHVGSVLKARSVVKEKEVAKLYDKFIDSVVLFLIYWSRNRKMEISSITKIGYQEAKLNEPLNKDRNSVAMSAMTKDVHVLGKRNAKVLVNVPQFLFSCVELILELHVELGLVENPYLFAKRATTDKFRDCASYFSKKMEALGLEGGKRNLGSQGARRAGCTKMFTMDFQENAKRIKQVDRRLGHHRGVSEKSYEKRLDQETHELGGAAVVASFYTKASEMAGKSFTDMDVATPLMAEPDAISGLPLTNSENTGAARPGCSSTLERQAVEGDTNEPGENQTEEESNCSLPSTPWKPTSSSAKKRQKRREKRLLMKASAAPVLPLFHPDAVIRRAAAATATASPASAAPSTSSAATRGRHSVKRLQRGAAQQQIPPTARNAATGVASSGVTSRGRGKGKRGGASAGTQARYKKK